MWKEVFDGEIAVDRMPISYSADDGDSCPSRRVSAASDDSFDASSYVHVDNKLESKMPKCLLNDENSEKSVDNHFSKNKIQTNGNDVTKNGKRVIRKRLSVSQFNAVKLNAKNNLNNNSNNELSTSSSSDCDTLPKSKKRSTNILSAKIQHLLFEMKRLRQLDRDILRKFLIINDTIEEQRWMVEEKQEAIKRCLSEEGEDPVTMNFEVVPEVLEEQEDDEESIQSVLSRQNSSTEVFNDTLSVDEPLIIKEPSQVITKDVDLVSTSTDSALSMSGASSTLSSTTSLPVSTRSSSPPTSNFSTVSAASSSVDSVGKKPTVAENIHTARTGPVYTRNDADFEDDIEGYYRMHGASMKRGSYPFPRQAHSFDVGNFSHAKTQTYDDNALDSAYSTRRGSTDSDSRDAAEYALAVRRSIVNRSYAGPFRVSNNDTAHMKPRPRSASTSKEAQDARNRVQRISVRPDGTRDVPVGGIPSKRPYSANDKSSAAYRLLQHPNHQRHLARSNMNRQVAHLSFVPIAEQEPDMMFENGRLYSNDSDSKFDSESRDYQNLIDLSRQRQVRTSARQCPPVMRKPSAAGSAGSLTSSSSRTSSSSLASSSSNSSLHSPTKFVTNEADRCPRPAQEPVWVQRRRHSVQSNDYIAIPHNKAFPAAYSHKFYNPRRNHGVHNLPDPKIDNARPKLTKRASMPHTAAAYRPHPESNRVLTVSYKSTNEGANEAVYNWIQTQDDVTYL